MKKWLDKYDDVPQAQTGWLGKMERNINRWLGDPMEKAYDAAQVNPKEDDLDNYRHPMAGRYTSEAIQKKTGGIPVLSPIAGFIGANVLGIGHELVTLAKDERPISVKLRESGEDAFNNMVGAAVGSFAPMTAEQKSKFLLDLSYKNRLPDGYGSGNMYFKKKDGGLLDKYNNVPQAENGIEGTMGGLTDIGFNYNGAWGGTMQMGGAMPGAVGFTYARVAGAAPANGPYAKKTKASAQDGASMKYYQEGLDFKPKTISQDGIILPLVDLSERGRGDMASYYPELKQIKTKAATQLTKKEAEKIALQEAARKAIQNQPTVRSARPDYKTQREKERDLKIRQLEEIQRNSPLVQTLSSFTPSGNNPEAGMLGAQSFSENILAVPQSALNLTRFATGRSPYGDKTFDKSLGVGSDLLTLGLGAVGTGLVPPMRGPVSVGPYTFGLNRYIRKENVPVRQIFGNEAFQSFQKYGPTVQPGVDQSSQIVQFARLPESQVQSVASGQMMDIASLPRNYGFPYFSQGSKWYSGASEMKNLGSERLIVPKKGSNLTFYPAGEQSVMKNFDELPASLIESYAGRRRLLAPFGNFSNPRAFNVYQPKWYGYKKVFEDGGDIPVDPMGYWNPDNIGEPVIIPSNEITMEGVDQPLIGISDTGDVQYMEPGEDYEFDGEYVTEYPIAKSGVSVNNADAQPIEKLDQLLNFTNYNKPTKGGWLDKYQ